MLRRLSSQLVGRLAVSSRLLAPHRWQQVVPHSEKEKQLHDDLKERLNAIHVEVEDVSGGCGQSFRVYVASENFEGKSVIDQHRLVKAALFEQVPDAHAIVVHTETASKFKANPKRQEG
mmetsp:Transcript_16715/g.39693  ORF Transcript_16715/g.39693 Transcript_16715/m.39693 type:complete len:119 (-) Transcript_16715:582-938(-)